MVSTNIDVAIDPMLQIVKEPAMAFDTVEFRLATANDAMLKLWPDIQNFIGKSIFDAIPALNDHQYLKVLWQQAGTGTLQNVTVVIAAENCSPNLNLELQFNAVPNANGLGTAIISLVKHLPPVNGGAENVNENDENLQESHDRLAFINQQYQTTINELNALNEEYKALNESLIASNEEVKYAYKEVERIESKMRLAIDAANLGTWHVVPKDNSLSYNKTLANMFGYEAETPMTYEQAIGQVVNEHRPIITAAINTAIANGGNYEVDYQQARFNDGNIRWFRSLGKIIPSQDSNAFIFSGIVIDITEQMAVQKVIADSEERFRSLAEGSEMMIAVNDLNGKAEYVNQAWLTLLGYSAEEVAQFELGAFILPEEKEAVVAEFMEGMSTQEPFTLEFRVVDKNNLPRWVYTKVNPRYATDGSFAGTISTSVDMTELLTHQEKLQEANIRLSIALEAGGFGSAEVDLATGTVIANDQYKKCYGRSPSEDFTYNDLLEAILPAYRDDVKSTVAAAQKNHTTCHFEYEVCWPDGSIHWLSVHGKARYDKHGKAIKMVAMVSDITEKKQDEQRKNDFIGMVSHELKTPLTSINGFLQLLQVNARKREDQFSLNALNKTLVQVKRMKTMINGFLDVSRLNSGKLLLERQEFDFATLLREIETEIAGTNTHHHIRFEEIAAANVFADKAKISQVIHNFIDNAIKYAPPQTTIKVTSSLVDGSVKICVADEGMGVKPEDKTRLFDRYYRVVDSHMTNISGFGIGLYLCAEIIHSHHGKIWVESEFGQGATFCFTLATS